MAESVLTEKTCTRVNVILGSADCSAKIVSYVRYPDSNLFSNKKKSR